MKKYNGCKLLLSRFFKNNRQGLVNLPAGGAIVAEAQKFYHEFLWADLTYEQMDALVNP